MRDKITVAVDVEIRSAQRNLNELTTVTKFRTAQATSTCLCDVLRGAIAAGDCTSQTKVVLICNGPDRNIGTLWQLGIWTD